MRRSRICVLAAGTLLAAAAGIAGTASAAAAGMSSHISRPVNASITAVPPIAAAADPFNLANFLSTVIGRRICLGISGGVDEGPAIVFACNTHPDQEWHFGNAFPGDAVYSQIINGNNDCLSLQGGNTATGTQLVARDCGPIIDSNQHKDQFWFPTAVDCSGYHPLLNLKATQAHNGTDFVAGTRNHGTANGTAVEIRKYENVCNDQFWSP